MGDTSAMAAAFEEAMKSGEFTRMGEILQQYATDDSSTSTRSPASA